MVDPKAVPAVGNSAIFREGLGRLSGTDFDAGCILVIDKPHGWTSFDVIRKLKPVLRNPNGSKVKKIGHAGTLDPFATGVLLVCTGRSTKQVSALMDLEKEYLAGMRLGRSTDSHDVTGQTTAEAPVPELSRNELEAVTGAFVGEIGQVPPMHSAIKIGGKRLYKLARKGKTVEREPRRVYIHRIEIVDVVLPVVTFRVTCSKGTYIRALARDIGEQIGCGAYLESLVRTRIGEFSVDRALQPDQIVGAFKRTEDGARPG